MEKVKLHFSIEQTIERLDDAFFDRAVECITAMHRLWQQGIEPRSCQVGDYAKEVYGYIEVTKLDTEPTTEE